MLKTKFRLDSFLRKQVRDEISFVSDGNAFLAHNHAKLTQGTARPIY